MRFLPEEDTHLGFQLAPMIDVVFMLLVFFIVAGSYKQTETELRVKLPNLTPGQPPPVMLQVVIDADGSLRANDVPYDDVNSRELPQLRSKMVLLVDTDRNLPVIIIPDADAPHQRVMDVLNACHAAGVSNISFAGGEGGKAGGG